MSSDGQLVSASPGNIKTEIAGRHPICQPDIVVPVEQAVLRIHTDNIDKKNDRLPVPPSNEGLGRGTD
jgi:hypothetical protein